LLCICHFFKINSVLS